MKFCDKWHKLKVALTLGPRNPNQLDTFCLNVPINVQGPPATAQCSSL